jgi:hypothetical protein
VNVKGRYVRSLDDLISASLGPEQAGKARGVLHLIWNRVPTRFIPGGQQQAVFRIPKSPEYAQVWDMLSEDSPHWNIEFCYCSVFQECWQVQGQWQEPRHIKECRRDESREFIP